MNLEDIVYRREFLLKKPTQYRPDLFWPRAGNFPAILKMLKGTAKLCFLTIGQMRDFAPNGDFFIVITPVTGEFAFIRIRDCIINSEGKKNNPLPKKIIDLVDSYNLEGEYMDYTLNRSSLMSYYDDDKYIYDVPDSAVFIALADTQKFNILDRDLELFNYSSLRETAMFVENLKKFIYALVRDNHRIKKEIKKSVKKAIKGVSKELVQNPQTSGLPPELQAILNSDANYLTDEEREFLNT